MRAQSFPCYVCSSNENRSRWWGAGSKDVSDRSMIRVADQFRRSISVEENGFDSGGFKIPKEDTEKFWK